MLRERAVAGGDILAGADRTCGAGADIEIMNGDYEARALAGVYGYKEGWGKLGTHLADEITALIVASLGATLTFSGSDAGGESVAVAMVSPPFKRPSVVDCPGLANTAADGRSPI